MPQHRQLCDVPPKEECNGPVDDHTELPRQEGELIQVVGPGYEPTWETAQAKADDVSDSLVATEGGDLAEHAVAVRLASSAEVLRKAAGLPESVLASGRIRMLGRGFIRHAGAVAEPPDVSAAF